ncbi:helix-turn-helix domain-containing protein [Pseudactinotalea sp. Z1748]|uniref:AraC family transcriptional regulator n=1 Tax=Pseudactinotalea sp. Z1748 TaxID=3413027 RepID=UPI003C79F176
MGTSASLHYVPVAALAPGVLSAVGYHHAGVEPGLHLGIPAPSLTFIFSTRGPIEVGASAGQATGPGAERAQVLISRLHTDPAYVVEPGEQAGIQMAVHPLAARSLLGVPARELDRLALEGSDVLGPGAARTLRRLQDMPLGPQAFAVVGDYLREQLQQRRAERVRPEVGEAWRWMSRTRGAGSMRNLAAHVALSQRQLTTLFQREVGMAPKAIARLIRFTRARRMVVQHVALAGSMTLAHVAHACGYADQSHLVRDFQQYTGTSPTQWLRQEHQYVQAGAHVRAAG